MKIKLLLIATIYFINSLNSYIFSQEKNELFGKWESYKIELENGDDGSGVTLTGEPFDNNSILLNFEKNNDVIFTENNNSQKATYSFNNNILIIGNRRYKIEKLNTKKLILLESDIDNPYKLFNIRIFLEKKL
jgi:hypothetical protein